MDQQTKRIAEFAARLLQDCVSSGLSWDEAVHALGIAARGLAGCASKAGDGLEENCIAHARERFAEGFAQHVEVEMSWSNGLDMAPGAYFESDDDDDDDGDPLDLLRRDPPTGTTH